MNTFFLLVEIFIYAFSIFLFFKKKDLLIIYLPVLIFCNNLIVPTFPAFIYYGTLSFLLLSCIVWNTNFFRNNIFSVFYFIYFLILLTRSSDLEAIRSSAFSFSWLLLSIPLIYTIFRKYDEQNILKEIGNSAFLILGIFLINVLFSSIYRYSPNPMYGITSGILYGNLYGAGFNILSVALFAGALKFLDTRQPLKFIILIISFAALLLSLRRSVMLVGALGLLISMLSLLAQKEAKKFLVISSLLFALGYFIYEETSFMDLFNERYEIRKLDDRPLDEEKRFSEYELIYKDMFEYEEYSSWFGYEPLNSAGNYGGGIFESRTLHSDLPSIAHSSGILGLILYLLTIITAFIKSYRLATTTLDKLILFFCLVAFTTFTMTGRFTEAASMIFIFTLINMPVAGSCSVTEVDMQEMNDLVPASNLRFN